MNISAEAWVSSALEAAGRILKPLSLPVLEALSNGNLESAQRLSEEELTPFLISDRCRSVWARRTAQIKLDDEDAIWVTRLIVDSKTGLVVGRAGYHGKPDENGMVEIGYETDPLYRRRGHARAALRILLDIARLDPRVNIVRATVQPSNLESRSLIDQYGFQVMGEQWDDEDGLEIILEVSVS